MKKNAVLFLADGFEEVEALATVDVLRRAGVDVTIAGVTGEECVGAHGIKVCTDKKVEDVVFEDYDAFICPGGGQGAENLKNSPIVKSLLLSAFDSDKLVAAICAAPMVLEAAGFMNGKKCTIYPGMEGCLDEAKYIDQNIVIDNNIITAAGPAITFDFAFKLVEYLVGKNIADRVATDMLFI